MHAYDASNPTPEAAYDLIVSALVAHPRRLAVIGGSDLVRFVAGEHPLLERLVERRRIPVINHADRAKEDVLEWVADARERGLAPGSADVFDDFCSYMGLEPELIRELWTVYGPLYEALETLLGHVSKPGLPVQMWSHLGPGENVDAKVRFVDAHACFAPAVAADKVAAPLTRAAPGDWAGDTAARGSRGPLCLNADTETFEEAQTLRDAGWTIVCVGPQAIDGDLVVVSPVPKGALELAEALSAGRQEARR